jgi:hypothetical protein
MNFIAVEAPSPGVAGAREALEFFDTPFRIVSSGYGLQVVADELIEALAEGFGFLAGARHKFILNGERNVHQHSTCGHGLCVN